MKILAKLNDHITHALQNCILQ